LKDGQASIKDAFKSLVPKEKKKQPEKTPKPNSNQVVRDEGFLGSFLRNEQDLEVSVQNDETNEIELTKKLENEITIFTSIICDSQQINNITTSQSFWSEKVHVLPNLKKLWHIINNIPSSSAFIERFFSICGVICDVRSGAMKDDLIQKRCLMKANFNIIKELAQKE
jgi:hypothetical protein